MTTTTTFNRNQILRLTRETLDNTLRFFHTVNERLFTVVNHIPTAEVRPMNMEEVTRICTDFHRDHETRMTQLTTIWNDLTTQLRDQLPTTTPNLFDTNDVIRLNRELIDHTMRFFTTTNEALLQGRLPQTPEILPRHVVETITNAVQTFQKTQTDVLHTFEQTFHKVLNTLTPTTPVTPQTEIQNHHTPINVVRDEIFTLNRDIIDNTIRFFMNLNEHVVSIIENHDPKNVTLHTGHINQIRQEYLNTHQMMVDRLNTCIRRTAETLSVTPQNLTHVTHLTPLFDHSELLHINHDAIASTVKFFNIVTENLLTRNDRDTLIHATEEFQKTHRILTGRIETIWTETVNRVQQHVTRTHETRTVENTPNNIHNHVNETRNQTVNETCCNHVNETAKPVNHHAEPINQPINKPMDQATINTPVTPKTTTNKKRTNKR